MSTKIDMVERLLQDTRVLPNGDIIAIGDTVRHMHGGGTGIITKWRPRINEVKREACHVRLDSSRSIWHLCNIILVTKC
jgi:hypothetical protein